MLRNILMIPTALLLLAACEQQSQAVSAPPAAPLPQAYTVCFDTRQSALSPEAIATVSQAAAAFKQSGTAVGVRGHADTVGSAEFSLRLSRQRATAVRDVLQRNGVPAAAILSGGVGEQNLRVATPDQTPERRNRSVDIAISKQALMSDADYCHALSASYRRYRPGSIDEAATRAMSVCSTDPASAIPLLEDHITTMKVPLPSRVVARS
jgi:hypothetical protein